jgi:NRPS condensation-like uncharacterized protein
LLSLEKIGHGALGKDFIPIKVLPLQSIPMKDKTSNTKSLQEKGWIRLDNAAKLYPAIISEDLTSVFRITASLKRAVNYSKIKQAVEITSERFPYFSVSLGSGLFWHFLEFNNRPPRIQPEEEIPCTAFAVKRKDEPLYRVIVKGSRISVEFIHILTDGYGALEYLKSLLHTYLTISGNSITSGCGIILPDTPVSTEEMEDGYNKFFRKLPPPSKLVKAWHLPFKLNDRPRLKVIRAEVSVNEMLCAARNLKVSITEYIVSVYIFALQQIYTSARGTGRRKMRRVIRVEVPVNMRNKFPSRTMRNFSLFVLPELDLRLGNYSFEEILQSVHHQLQISSDIKQIARFLSSNVSYEKLLLVRVMPLFIKKMVISAIYRGLASKRFTGLVTNLGPVILPDEMRELIDSFELISPPPNPEVKVGIALVSFEDRLRICFSNITKSTELERLILTHLTKSGIHVRILNNE